MMPIFFSDFLRSIQIQEADELMDYLAAHDAELILTDIEDEILSQWPLIRG
jgi:hypothetical protein